MDFALIMIKYINDEFVKVESLKVVSEISVHIKCGLIDSLNVLLSKIVMLNVLSNILF